MPTALPALRDVTERNALASANIKLVYWVVARLKHLRCVQRLGLDEAQSVGAEALMRAAELYDETLGFTFSTYAIKCIRRRILCAASEVRDEPLSFTDISADQDSHPDPAAPPDAGAARRDDAGQVEKLLGRLPPRWGLILAMRYGLRGHRPHTLHQIGQLLGVSRPAVAGVEGRALERLRRAAQRLRLPPVG